MTKSLTPAKLRPLAVSFAALALSATAALAQSSLPPTQGGRFTMQQVDTGVIRMDTQTGAISMCKKQGAGDQWSCESLPDERKALQLEVDRLTKENAELHAEMKRLEDDLKKPERHADRGPDDKGIGRMPLPTEDDVDKAMGYLKGMYKKLKEKLKEFEDLEGKKTEKL